MSRDEELTAPRLAAARRRARSGRAGPGRPGRAEPRWKPWRCLSCARSHRAAAAGVTEERPSRWQHVARAFAPLLSRKA